MPKLANLVTQKAVLTAVSVGALVLGGASVAAVAAPDESPVEHPVSARAASEAYALDAADEPQAESSEPAEVEAPEVEAPETEAPKTEAPEAEAPETETPEAEAPETEAPETDAPEVEAPDAGIPAEQASAVAQQATTAAHAQSEDRYPGSVSDVVLQYLPAASKPAPDSVPQAAAPSAAQPAAKPAPQSHSAGQGAPAKHGR